MTPRTRGLLRRKVKSKDETLPSVVLKRTENTHSVLTMKKWTKTKSKWIRVGMILITLFLWKRIALYNRLRRNITLYLVSQSESQEGVLWRGTIQKEDFSPLLLTSTTTTTTTSDSTTKIDLVVSHCDRPLNWIFDEWSSPFEFESIRIFSKCNKPVVGAPSKAEIIKLKNVGRCDHTYAHYIVQHYNKDDGNKDRFTLFLKDNDNSNRDVVSRHRSLAEMVAISKRDGFACHEEQSWDWSHKSLFDKEYRPICQFSAYSNWNRLQQFSREEYSRLKRDQNTNFKSVYGDTLGDYANQMGITVTNEIVPVCFGGNFMAQSNQTKKQSIEKWKRIEQSLSRGNNIAEGHYVERLWAILLARDLPKGVEIQLSKQQRSSCEPPEHFLGILTK